MSFSVNVDPTNPGQFFACCGLLELADRLWLGAEGRFLADQFEVTCEGDLVQFHRDLTSTPLQLRDLDNPAAGRIYMGSPFGLLMDWWHESSGREEARDFKVWTGRMGVFRIAKAMQDALRESRFAHPDMLNTGGIVYEPEDSTKKVEPYYFDARRGSNAHSRDIGFSPNDLSLTTTAWPAVEYLCLAGLQRCQPAQTKTQRIYDYFTWSVPLMTSLLPAAVAGLLPHIGRRGYRFENWFRTGQKKHKAFRPAISLFSHEVPDE